MDYNELMEAYKTYLNCKDTEEMNIQDTIQDLISELLKKGFRLCYKDDYVYPEQFYLEIEVD